MTAKYQEIRMIESVEELKSKLPSFFEGLTTEEADMLSRKISDLEDVPLGRIDELESAIDQLEYELDDLEDKLDDSEKECARR